MNTFAQTKVKIGDRLGKTIGKRKTLLIDMGRALIEEGALPEKDPFPALVSEEGAAATAIAEIEGQRDRISSIVARLDGIKQTQNDMGQRQKAIDSELEPKYREIGTEAFRVFRDNPLIDQEYAEIFRALLESHEETRNLERDLQTANAELADKNFLEKVVVRGRVIVLRNRLAIKEGQQRRMYTDAGRQIAGTDFVRTIGDPALDEAAAPFLELIEESKRLVAESGVLEDERKSLASELTTLGVERKADHRLAELNKELREAEAKHHDALMALARSAREAKLDSESIASRSEDLNDVEAEIERDQVLIERLEKAIEAGRVQADIDQLTAQIERKRQQIASIEADIERLEKRRNDLSETEKQLEAERGSLDDLTDLEL